MVEVGVFKSMEDALFLSMLKWEVATNVLLRFTSVALLMSSKSFEDVQFVYHNFAFLSYV
jgi:hypothetical protein